MKLNWKTLKVVLVFVVVVGVAFWAVDSVRSRSYSGSDLSFDTAGGTITVTNPSDEPVAAQFIGTGSRSFRVSSTIEGVSGSSTRVESGSNRTHQFHPAQVNSRSQVVRMLALWLPQTPNFKRLSTR